MLGLHILTPKRYSDGQCFIYFVFRNNKRVKLEVNKEVTEELQVQNSICHHR